MFKGHVLVAIFYAKKTATPLQAMTPTCCRMPLQTQSTGGTRTVCGDAATLVGTQELNVLLDRFRLSVAAPRLGKVFIFNIVINFNPIFAFRLLVAHFRT